MDVHHSASLRSDHRVLFGESGHPFALARSVEAVLESEASLVEPIKFDLQSAGKRRRPTSLGLGLRMTCALTTNEISTLGASRSDHQTRQEIPLSTEAGG